MLVRKPLVLLALSLGIGFVALTGGKHASAASLCVNSDGSGGCMTSIQAAVSAANSGDTITVAPGTYNEDVTISTPLALVGAGASSTTINASGADNAVHIMADNVWLQGFTIRGARLDGVLVNGNDAQIMDNTITGNATLVIPPAPGGPPVPSAWNGLNLQNASDALVADNTVSNNAGRGIRTEGSAAYNFPNQGIQLVVMGRSDNNLIVDNTVENNRAACGIVLSTDSSNNVVDGNTVTNNPAGIVIATLPPFGLPNTPFADHMPHSDGNIIQNNTVNNNLGVGINVDANVGSDNNSIVAGNTVSGNAASAESGDKTVGVQVYGKPGTQVDGTLVMNNMVTNQDIAAWIAPNSSATNTQGVPAQ